MKNRAGGLSVGRFADVSWNFDLLNEFHFICLFCVLLFRLSAAQWYALQLMFIRR